MGGRAWILFREKFPAEKTRFPGLNVSGESQGFLKPEKPPAGKPLAGHEGVDLGVARRQIGRSPMVIIIQDNVGPAGRTRTQAVIVID